MWKHTKVLADALTVARGALGVSIAGLGLLRGRSALATVVGSVIIAWLSDLIDGPLARRDEAWRATWVGEHDPEADLAVSLGTAVYLVLSDYLMVWVGASLVVIILLLWGLHSHQLAWPFYAVPYVILLRVALREAPVLGWLAVVHLVTTFALRWRRLVGEFVPQFFDAVASLHLAHRNGSEGARERTTRDA